MNTDLTFITNETDASLLNRSLVDYFYTSGLYKLGMVVRENYA